MNASLKFVDCPPHLVPPLNEPGWRRVRQLVYHSQVVPHAAASWFRSQEGFEQAMPY